MIVIINRGAEFSTVNGQAVKTREALSTVNKALKNGAAKLLLDTDSTLMYRLTI